MIETSAIVRLMMTFMLLVLLAAGSASLLLSGLWMLAPQDPHDATDDPDRGEHAVFRIVGGALLFALLCVTWRVLNWREVLIQARRRSGPEYYDAPPARGVEKLRFAVQALVRHYSR